MYKQIATLVEAIKQQRPLVLNLTNYVTMDFIANGLLSVGASPIMTHAMEEVRDLVRIAQCVVINLGTLDEPFIRLCEAACRAANEMNKPLIFDPVGAGASQYRTTTCLSLLEQYQFATIRGNASEILALCGKMQTTKGVDSTLNGSDVIDSAHGLSTKLQATVAITGKTDVIVTNDKVNRCERGVPIMPFITGSGCLLTAVIAAFHGVESDPHVAARAAINFYGVCGELAAKHAMGPGSFKMHFVDALSQFPKREDYEAI
ncbi:hydroxyethylthiazole kinase [Legionella sp. W05-934-2]|uniref:hydroxyethylthiazole kinase n=1 Tax=Legionella sp. W05-934-2 TaxID=1198649 RepID=UPI003462E88B